MVEGIKNIISRGLVNLKGWKTNRKLVVIESDDWGSIRMPSVEVYNELKADGIPVQNCPYNRNDSIETSEDLSELFHVLSAFKDVNGKPPVITANYVMANPDFNAIRNSQFNMYTYEPFAETYKRYEGSENAFSLVKQAMTEGYFKPQFHGREHVNIKVWLKFLQSGNTAFLKAFEKGMWGLGPNIIPGQPVNVQASFDTKSSDDLLFQEEIISDGLNLFEKQFGFRSESFIANNFIWDPKLEETLSRNGVVYLQGMKYQKAPLYNSTKRALIQHSLGEVNRWNQIYLVRNCDFEPSQRSRPELETDRCLSEMANAFFFGKPAIINSHRINFIGRIRKENREMGLTMLSDLLSRATRKWPDLEFISSDELGKILAKEKLCADS